MKQFYLLLRVGLLFLAISSRSYGQDRLITGQITDDLGDPIPGTSILIKNTTIGTVADLDGMYSINAPVGSTLIFSFVGFMTREIEVGNQSRINVQLSQQLSDLGEVVVVGYGVQRKSDLTGSVSSVGERDIKQVAVASLDQALQGRAAGVQVTQASAAPGGGVSIRIRGGNSINASNEPLYVIDGVPIFPSNSTYSPGTTAGGQAQNALANINPGDIESMEILKDASATAIYGSRGANGVVIVTTKRGKAGATNIDFESYYGIQEVSRTLPLLNAEEFAIIANEARVNRGQSEIFSAEEIANFRNNSTDWQDKVFREAPIQNHQITISGGDKKTRYAISGNYFDQQGVIINSGFTRGSMRINVDKTINNKVTVGNSLTISRAINNQQVTDVTRGGVVNGALVFSPTLPVYNEEGEFTFDNSAIPGSQQVGNPVQDALETLNKNLTNRILGNLYLEWEIISDLKFRASGGLDYQAGRRDYYAPSTNNRGRNAFGSALVEKKDVFSPVGTFTLNYSNRLRDNHFLTLLAGYESQSQMVDYVGAQATNFPTDALGSDNLGLGQIVGTPFSGRSLWRLDSWFGRVNYTLYEKFLFTGTFRADGSSRFGAGNKWGYFPSAAVGYNMSNESFIQAQNVLSSLKLTTSWGLTGNQEIGLYQSLSQLNTQRNAFGNIIAIGLAPGRIPNPDLRWEKTNQINVGLEFGLWEDRVFFEAAAYYKKTQDLLLPLDLPRSTGFSTILQNIGSVENRGLEIAVNSNNLNGTFSWVTNANITFNRNKVLQLGPGESFRLAPGTGDGHLQISNSSILQVGSPVGSFFGMVTDGIYQEGEEVISGSSSFGSIGPGDIRYVDVNGDGVINNNDRTIIGNPQPNFFYGITNNFTYKNLDLSIFLQGVYGNDVWNVNSHELYRNDGATNNVREVLNRWTPENPSNEWPSARTRPFVLSDRHIEDASFLRVRNITLGYQLPVVGLGINWLRSCRIYAQGQNLLTFTNYSGFDPEVNSFGQNPIGIGIDRGTFPMARTFILGVNFGL